MDPNDWTPTKGMGIALGKTAYRAAIGAVVLGALLFLVWPLVGYLPSHWAITGVLLLMSAGVGYPIGYAVRRGLVEDSGLAGSTIVVPVLLIMLAMEIGVCCLVASIRDDVFGAAVLAFGAMLWSAGACVKIIWD